MYAGAVDDVVSCYLTQPNYVWTEPTCLLNGWRWPTWTLPSYIWVTWPRLITYLLNGLGLKQADKLRRINVPPSWVA